MTNLTTYPRIDADRGVALRVDRAPGEKVCARISLRHTASTLAEPTASPAPLRGFLLESHRTACLSVCLTIIRDTWPRAPQTDIHRAMVVARRVLEGGGTIRAAVHWGLKLNDDYDLRSPSC